MKTLLVLLTCMCVCGCATNDGEAVKAMDDNGFTNIQVVDRGFMASWEGCSDSDQLWYSVSATNAAGKHVTMTVCCGGPLSLKGCTIRSK